MPAHVSHLVQSFFGEMWNQPGDSGPLQPRFGAPWLLAFPKVKITFEKEEVSDHWWDSGKCNEAADGNWEMCEVLRCLLWRRLRHHCPMYTVSCVLYFLQKMSLFFIWYDWVPSGQTCVSSSQIYLNHHGNFALTLDINVIK